MLSSLIIMCMFAHSFAKINVSTLQFGFTNAKAHNSVWFSQIVKFTVQFVFEKIFIDADSKRFMQKE